jgi:hypothetical protein
VWLSLSVGDRSSAGDNTLLISKVRFPSHLLAIQSPTKTVTNTSLDEVHGKKQLLERESDNALPIKTRKLTGSCAIVCDCIHTRGKGANKNEAI